MVTNRVVAKITCPVCGMTSYNPTDVSEGYCGNCHDWTSQEDIRELDRQVIADPPPSGLQTDGHGLVTAYTTETRS